MEEQKNRRENVNILIDNLTLFDDDLMSRVFDQNIEATELILRIILERDIKVINVEGQEEFKNHDVRGRDQMCEAVEQFAKEYADEEIMKSQINNVQNLMDNVNFTLEQALDALKIQGHEREVIIEHFKK